SRHSRTADSTWCKHRDGMRSSAAAGGTERMAAIRGPLSAKQVAKSEERPALSQQGPMFSQNARTTLPGKSPTLIDGSVESVRRPHDRTLKVVRRASAPRAGT